MGTPIAKVALRRKGALSETDPLPAIQIPAIPTGEDRILFLTVLSDRAGRSDQ
jgi:hypothetical protein